MRGKLVHELNSNDRSLELRFGDGLWVMVEFGTSSAVREWVRVSGYGFELSNLLPARSLLSHAPKGASKMLRATGHARMVRF